MTSREKQVCAVIEALGGAAHPTEIGRRMGVSGDYAEQICRDLVWHGMIVKNGLKYALVKESSSSAGPETWSPWAESSASR